MEAGLLPWQTDNLSPENSGVKEPAGLKVVVIWGEGVSGLMVGVIWGEGAG